MHVAICDDNIADRKHLERLLSRESDKRAGTPNILYIDSYGDKDQFLQNPLKYDIIFLDMTATDTLAEEIVHTLCDMGLDAPIVMYTSKIDYSANPNLPENVIHMKKPYIPDPLPELLKLGDAHVIGTVETITVHFPGNVLHYVPKNDILYGMPNDSGTYYLYMNDQTKIEILETPGEFQKQAEPYPEFCRINKTVVVNMKYVSLITPLTIMTQDYREFHYSPLRYREMKELKYKIDDLY